MEKNEEKSKKKAKRIAEEGRKRRVRGWEGEAR